MTDKLRDLLEDVQTVYEGKGMIVHPNSFDKLRTEIIKLDNVNKQQSEQIKEMRCCSNCKNCNRKFIKKNTFEHTCKVEHCRNYDKWEMKEK